MVVQEEMFWLLFLCTLRLQGADLMQPFASDDTLTIVDPTLESNSRYSSASNTPLSPEIPVWDKQAFAFVVQKQKNDRYKKRKRWLQVAAVFAGAGTLAASVANFFSDNCDFNGYATGASALATVSYVGSICIDCLIDGNTTVAPILKPRDLPRDDTQGSLEAVPEEM